MYAVFNSGVNGVFPPSPHRRFAQKWRRNGKSNREGSPARFTLDGIPVHGLKGMNKIRFQRMLRRAFAIPFGIGLLLAVTLIFEVQFLAKRSASVEHSDQIIAVSQHLYRAEIDQETGLRAYFLTNDKRFMEPFYEARKEAGGLEGQLQQLISDDPEQQARNEKARQTFRDWSSWADQTMALTMASEDTSDPELQLPGKELMNENRKILAEIIGSEEQIRDERLSRSRRTIRLVNISVVALCFLMAGVLALFGTKQLKSLSGMFDVSLDAVEANAAKARAQGERLASILQSAMDAVITVDQSQRIQVFNRTAEQMFRCPASEALGQPLNRFIPERFRQAHDRHVQEFGHTGVTSRSMSRPGILWGLRGDGEEFPIEATISQIGTQDEKLFTVILRDITERLRAEQFIHEAEERLRGAEALAATGKMAATLAHEINNPMAAITNLAYIIRTNPKLPVRLRPQAELLDQELKRVTHIVHQTLGLYREQAAPPQAVRLGEVVDEVLELYKENLSGFAIDKRYESDGLMMGNRAELYQLVSNLILNVTEAVRDDRSLKIHLSQSLDWQDLTRSGIRLVIADSGTGIPPEVRPHIFKPFFTTKQQKGTGLGLFVAQWVAAKHGGAVRIRSSTQREHSGTCVSVFFCADAGQEKAPSQTHSTIYESQAAS